MTKAVIKGIFKIVRGLEEELPILRVGELGYATDTNTLFIGDPDEGNVKINFDNNDREMLNSKVDKVTGKSLVSDTEIARLANVDNYDDSEIRGLIPTKVSDLTNDRNYLTSIPSEYITETELNTSLSNKVDKEVGKGLSTNDLTNELVTKIDNAATQAYVTNAIAEAQLGGDEVDLSDYATKTYADNAVSTALDGHTFKFLTQAEYDDLEIKDPLVEYHITDSTEEEKFATKAELEAAIGDINTILDNINGEVI